MDTQQTSNVTALHPEQPVQPPTLWNPIEPWHEPVGSEIFAEVEEFLNTHYYFHTQMMLLSAPYGRLTRICLMSSKLLQG